MNIDYFDKALHFLGKSDIKINGLNVGAMDGVMFDELIGYTNMYGYNVLYVEPIPYLFDKLKNNLKNVGSFENSAISDYDGEIEMIMIDPSVIDNGLVHSCFYGMSAVYPPKNGLGSEFDKPTVDKYGKMVKLPCITLNTLLTKYNFFNYDFIKIDTEGHDFKIFSQINFERDKPKVVRLEWINLPNEEQKIITETFDKFNYKYQITGQDITGISNELYNIVIGNKEIQNNIKIDEPKLNSKITLVTGIWDIGREKLSGDWSRSFNHYLEKFEQLLKIENNLIIFGTSDLREFVFKIRNNENTQFIERPLKWFTENEHFEKIQKIRTDPKWYNLAGWLSESTQARLEMYNPLVMSKMFLLHDAKILDKFNSEYLFWIDGGLTNTVHPGYFTHDKVLDKLTKYISKFSFICFPYNADREIHGFEINKINEIANTKIEKVARGGFFGGPKDSITNINNIYYGLLQSTLSDGYMGTEESLFSIMCYKHSDLINYFEIESNGLINRFFENLKNDTLVVKSELTNFVTNNLDTSKVGLYVIGFNSPNQFRTLIQSFIDYDINYLNKPRKFLIDNSNDVSTYDEYHRICVEYNFEHIKHNNLGICGGRQWIAEHFDESDLDYYLFFEDDMFFYPTPNKLCRNGFNRYVPNLYDSTLQIIKKENLDFLKLNFSEFYGDNGTQWSWYNVPQALREEFWPDKPNLPKSGLDPNAPKTKINGIYSYNGIPFVKGEIYYSNWPQIVSRVGNKKMFLDTKWAHPYEQTWMSHIFQLTKKGEISPGLLLLTPTEHNRFEHYDRSLRKES
jgi:FkbM family methyltransferase